ncbi:hypothetical protein Thiowin_01646 [Thiorhodovibrio winogradskyi]|uniref:DUF3611 family protein n=2 Tax=Thiorhodovibrio winogradskyi TaxID=77007 RepID=A0ABZ0S8R2_9GAMM
MREKLSPAVQADYGDGLLADTMPVSLALLSSIIGESPMAVAPWPPKNPAQLGATFKKIGWIGFITQLVLLAIPLMLALYMVLGFSPESPARKGIDLSNYLSYGSLIVTIFTAVWFFRYPRFGRRIAVSDPALSGGGVLKTIWIGVWASAIGIVFSMLLLFGSAGRMLFVMLANPQTGLNISPQIGTNPGQFISALDGISLISLLILLTAELVVLGLSMWLLYRTATPQTKSATQL